MCGIIGVQGSPEAHLEVYQGLLLLQHRGQDAAGILSFDERSREFHLHKEKGLVGQVFDKNNLSHLEARMAIGHTRYATIASKKSSGVRDLQPMLVNYPHGLGLVHNGNVVNVSEITELLKEQHQRIMLTKNDAEALLNLLASGLQNGRELSPLEQLQEASENVFDQARGGYAVVGLWANGFMFGLRDPHGIRPLVLGRRVRDDGRVSHILASESNVLNYLDYQIVRDIHPGELIAITPDGEVFTTAHHEPRKKSPCMFEWIYFATPESTIDGTPVYQARLNLGEKLGEKVLKLGLEVDVVVPVPESGRIAAIALSETIGVPYRELLIKNRYIQRSFILQDQASRNRAVELKLMAIGPEIRGKRILIVDDSIVRGTTSKKLIDLLRSHGAKEVYFVSTSPAIKAPCYFGIDFPLKAELIASSLNEEELAAYLGADGVIYQDLQGLKDSLGQEDLCLGCITGVYPFDLAQAGERFQQERLMALEEGTHG